MSLVKYLANLGYGTRREVQALMAQGRVSDAHGVTLRLDTTPVHTDVRVDHAPLDPPHGCVLMMHKPVGYVCSARDSANPLVFELLPPRFRQRTPKMVPIGRLDRDTSGLLLFTDDGALNHRLTSPRLHVAKVYDVTLAEPLERHAITLLESGTLMLANESAPLKPAHVALITSQHVRLTLFEGRYHQARRMFAAVGNHVVALHRTQVGALSIADLDVGMWRELLPHERAALMSSRASPTAAP